MMELAPDDLFTRRKTVPWLVAFLGATVLGLAGCASKAEEPTPAAARTVYVVRHAQALKNLDPRPVLPPEQLDRLTELGRQQAKALGLHLRDRGIRYVLCSPTGRTTETAQILSQVLDVPVQQTAALASLAGGLDETGGVIDFSTRTEAWSRGVDLRPVGGENLADGVQRALDRIFADPEGDACVVVTHGDIAAGLLGHAAGTAMTGRWERHAPPTGSATGLRLSAAGGELPEGPWQPSLE